MKISFISTVLNEQSSVEAFLDSLLNQSKMPDEVVICDGGSNDDTVRRIKNYEPKFLQKKVLFKVFIKTGNRAVGRNETIRRASGDIIACSDSGNILDRGWLENVTKPLFKKENEVAAGYYEGKTSNVLQKCLVPYVLVMPDKIDVHDFLPAARSMAFKKSVWKEVGEFDEKFSHNEDYVFARKLKLINARMVFIRQAKVYWIPPSTVRQAFVMFYRFALGDAEAKIYRAKVIFLFLRYLAGITFLFIALIWGSIFMLNCLFFVILLYLIWAIVKNFRYVKDLRAFAILPFWQIVSDAAVLSGTLSGLLK